MNLSIVVDMNLSLEWVAFLLAEGWRSVHWSQVGDPCAEDATIVAWARANGHIVLTHDLDFGTTLALTHESGPSVIQIRGQNILPENLSRVVIAAIHKYETELEQGALIVLDPGRLRVRILPL